MSISIIDWSKPIAIYKNGYIISSARYVTTFAGGCNYRNIVAADGHLYDYYFDDFGRSSRPWVVAGNVAGNVADNEDGEIEINQ